MRKSEPLKPRVDALKLHDPRIREFLWFCAPALAIGFVLRTLLMARMPFGYLQFDSVHFLQTPFRLLKDGAISVHNQSTFLAPVLFTIPFLLRIPALVAIPVAQHLLGLATVLLSGALVRLWFARWKWFIIPVTTALAVCPAMLWIEHALMEETIYLFCTMAVALLGTIFARRKTNVAFAWLLAALFFTAAARPEGRIYFLFAFLVLLFARWGAWKEIALKSAIIAPVALLAILLTPSGQSGQLLLATVLPLAPDQSRVFPDASAAIRGLRDKARAMHSDVAPEELTTLEKEACSIAEDYFSTHPNVTPKDSTFCGKIAIEAMLNRPALLPVLAFNKFCLAMKSLPTVGFDEHTVFEKQIYNFTRRETCYYLSKGLTGRRITTPEQAADFFHTNYHIDGLGWYASLERGWKRATTSARLPATRYDSVVVPGLPAFFLFAFIGLVTAPVSCGWRRIFHSSWLAMFAVLWFAVMLTGVVNARYRFVFEPFGVIYFFLLLDGIVEWCPHLCSPRIKHP